MHTKLNIKALATAAVLALAGAGASAADYPTGPVTIVVPSSPGGGADLSVRIIKDKLEARLGQPVVVENKPGGNALIGMREVANAKADGYTILYTATPFNNGPLLYKAFGSFNPVEVFEPIAMMTWGSPYIITNGNSQYKTFQSALEFARANPGKLNVGVPVGMNVDFQALMLALDLEVNMVKYDGTGTVIPAVLGSHVDIAIASMGGTARGLVDSGEILPLLHVSPNDSAAYAGVPSLKEFGIGENIGTIYNGFVAPAGMPTEIVERLNAEINEVLRDPEVVAQFSVGGGVTVQESAAKWGEVQKSEFERYKVLFDKLGITPQ